MTGTALQFTATPGPAINLAGVTASAVTGVDPTSDSSIAFVTYMGTGGILPYYIPGSGTLQDIQLTGSAIAPVAGVFSSDNSTFYVGTSGDNEVHLIDRGTLTDDPSKTIAPALPDATVPTNLATPNLLVQRPKKSTS
jgi:hypothetical protein